MYIIVGGTGHVGSATASRLIAQGQGVIVVTRDASKAESWRERGAEVAEADILDTAALRKIFKRGRRAFLLNPPAPPSTDTDKEERATARAILEALNDSGLEMVVAQSTYGACPGERIGDLSVLYEFEEGLRRQSIPAIVMRAAYLMSNWDQGIDAARDSGKLVSTLPADFQLPMVAPSDLGTAAAQFLQESAQVSGVTIKHVEGPSRYTPTDTANAIGKILGRTVEVDAVPSDKLEDAYLKLGFSQNSAKSFARMTRATIEKLELPASPHRGKTTIEDYIREHIAVAKMRRHV